MVTLYTMKITLFSDHHLSDQINFNTLLSSSPYLHELDGAIISMNAQLVEKLH